MRENYRRMHFSFPGSAPVEEMRLADAYDIRTEGHLLSLIAMRGVEDLIQRARALGAISINERPLTLRELFLECVKEEG